MSETNQPTQAEVRSREKIELLQVNTSEILFTEDRARKNYKDLRALGTSLLDRGMIQPIAVAKTTNPEKPYKLLAGGRRFSAAVLVGITSVPVRVYPETLTELEQKEIELLENTEREGLDWKEEVWLTQELDRIEKEIHGEAAGPSAGHSSTDTAYLLNKSKMTISRDKKLAKGLEAHPQALEKAKSKSEALKVLDKIDKKTEHTNAARKYEAILEKDDGESVKRTLIDSFILKDFFEGIQSVPEHVVNVVEIDPPYAIKLQSQKYTKAEAIREQIVEGYNEVEAAEYPEFLKKLFSACNRVLLPQGWIIVWHAPQWYETVQRTLKSTGFEVCPLPASWYKLGVPGQTNRPKLRMGSVVEWFTYARKGDAVLYKQGQPNIFPFTPVKTDRKVHPTERPIEMMENILEIFCPPGSNILVPFLGSGNTLLAASNLGYRAFGFELSQEYKDAFTSRVADGTPKGYKSYDR